MFTHTDIWDAIDRLAAAFGYSPSGLAKKAGLDPTTFNKSKRHSADGKPRWPSTESIAKILAVTGASMSDFTGLIADDADDSGGTEGAAIPLLDYALAGQAGFFDEKGYPAGEGWDRFSFSGSAAPHDEHIYALKVSAKTSPATRDSMTPLYREGDILVISPAAPIRRGDRIIVRTKSGAIITCEFIRQKPEQTTLRALPPEAETIALRPAEISWMARVIWVSQ